MTPMVRGGRDRVSLALDGERRGPIAARSPCREPGRPYPWRRAAPPPGGVPRSPAAVALLAVGGLLLLVSNELPPGRRGCHSPCVVLLPAGGRQHARASRSGRALAFGGLGTITVAVASARFPRLLLFEGGLESCTC